MTTSKCNKCDQEAYRLISIKNILKPFCKEHYQEMLTKRKLSKIKQMEKRQALENEMKY